MLPIMSNRHSCCDSVFSHLLYSIQFLFNTRVKRKEKQLWPLSKTLWPWSHRDICLTQFIKQPLTELVTKVSDLHHCHSYHFTHKTWEPVSEAAFLFLFLTWLWGHLPGLFNMCSFSHLQHSHSLQLLFYVACIVIFLKAGQ